MSAVTTRKVKMLLADLYVKQAALEEALDTGNTSLDSTASISAVHTSPVHTSAVSATTASISAVPSTASVMAAPATTASISAVPTSTTCFNCIHVIASTPVKHKVALSTLTAANKVDEEKEDADKKEENEKEYEVSASTNAKEVEEDIEEPSTTIDKVEEDH